jgi:hypothetical protein
MQHLCELSDLQFALLLISFAGAAFAAICVGVFWFEMSQRSSPWYHSHEAPSPVSTAPVLFRWRGRAGLRLALCLILAFLSAALVVVHVLVESAVANNGMCLR